MGRVMGREAGLAIDICEMQIRFSEPKPRVRHPLTVISAAFRSDAFRCDPFK